MRDLQRACDARQAGPVSVGQRKAVIAGRFQKIRPRAGAHPATLIGTPVYSA